MKRYLKDYVKCLIVVIIIDSLFFPFTPKRIIYNIFYVLGIFLIVYVFKKFEK